MGASNGPGVGSAGGFGVGPLHQGEPGRGWPRRASTCPCTHELQGPRGIGLSLPHLSGAGHSGVAGQQVPLPLGG